jgi:hypothetical protein
MEVTEYLDFFGACYRIPSAQREKTVSDHGIDMEVEFKDDNSEATGKLVLLQPLTKLLLRCQGELQKY